MITDNNLSYLQASIRSVFAYTISIYKHAHTHKQICTHVYLQHLFTKENKIYVCVYCIYSYIYIYILYIHVIIYSESKERFRVEKENNREETLVKIKCKQITIA